MKRIKALFQTCKAAFYRAPIFMTLAASLAAAAAAELAVFLFEGGLSMDSALFYVLLLFWLLAVSAALTLQNILFLILKPKTGKEETAVKKIELLTVSLGALLSYFYFYITDIQFADWNEQLYNYELHTPIETGSVLTVSVIAAAAVLGYLIARFLPLRRQPPLVTVLCIAAMYLGAAECVLWCIQILTDAELIPLCILPLNCVLIAAKTIRSLAEQKAGAGAPEEGQTCGRLRRFLFRISARPLPALLAALPLLGLIVALLTLFGQEPDSVIKAWTQTADWTLSQKIAPQNIYYDQHYLCTVAAGGHRRVVKPLRTGLRHGHRVVVNRQLCIANSFEQLLEERTPRLHRIIRSLYDKTGYPLARHIRSPFLADIIYFGMKPLEWTFLAVLYLFDCAPENRIAVQYPHAPLPQEK